MNITNLTEQKSIKYRLQMVYGGNIRVYLGKKYIGTYFSYGDLENDIPDLETKGNYWGKNKN